MNDETINGRLPPPKRRGLLVRIIHFLTGRRFGKVPTPMQVLAYRPRLLKAYTRMELTQMKASGVPAAVKSLASIRTSTLVGCPF